MSPPNTPFSKFKLFGGQPVLWMHVCLSFYTLMHFLTGSARYERLSEVVSDWSVVEIPANDWFDASAMVAREVVMVLVLTSWEGVNAAGDVDDLHDSTIEQSQL